MANELMVLHLKRILILFGQVSGLQINLDKSVGTLIGRHDDELEDRLTSIIGCGIQKLPWSYLGIPLCIAKPPRVAWTSLIAAVDKKLARWKSNFLSLGGRLVLLKATLSALPIHLMTIFRLPSWVIRKIDQIRRRFLWHGCVKVRGFVPIEWSIVTASLDEGGLGVLDLSTFNLALLGRQWWKVLGGEDEVWVKLVLHNYYRRRLICSGWHGQIRSCSVFWKQVMKAEPAFRSAIRWLPRDGSRTLTWYSNWEGTPLCDLFPHVFEVVQDQVCLLRDSIRLLEDGLRV